MYVVQHACGDEISFAEIVLFFHIYMGSVDETEAFRLALSGRKCLYLLNHLASSISLFFFFLE